MSLFGIALKLFGRFSNGLLAPMLLLIYHSFSILPKTLPLGPLVFFVISVRFRILPSSNNSMLWLMVYPVVLSLLKMRGILGKFSCLVKTIQPWCFSHLIFWMFQYMVSRTWSRKSRIMVSVCSEGSLLISMTWVDIQDEPRRVKSVGTLAV